MPVPPFTTAGLLPPYLGNAALNSAFMSPFEGTAEELVSALGTSGQRVRILDGFLRLRKALAALDLHMGFQWVGGSFVERRSKEPNDLDVVTFFVPPVHNERPVTQEELEAKGATKLFGRNAKQDFLCDHFPVALGGSAAALVNSTRYWFGLFGHTRDDDWKGLLRLQTDPISDAAAARLLAQMAEEFGVSL